MRDVHGLRGSLRQQHGNNDENMRIIAMEALSEQETKREIRST